MGGGLNLEQGEIGTSFGTWSEHVGVEEYLGALGFFHPRLPSLFAISRAGGIASDTDASRKDF